MLYLYTPQGVEMAHPTATGLLNEGGITYLVRMQGEHVVKVGSLPANFAMSSERMSVGEPMQLEHAANLLLAAGDKMVGELPHQTIARLQRLFSRYKFNSRAFKSAH